MANKIKTTGTAPAIPEPKRGQIYQHSTDSTLYILAQVDDHAYACICLIDGHRWGDPEFTPAKACDGLRFFADSVEFTVKVL